MPNDKALEAAKNILDDRNGADYYQDTNILADYLKSALELSPEAANLKAEAIQADRNGADYYADEKILADFLSS